ncbi:MULTISPECIES: hypothetical protein [unclassified Pedobacter]|uniref:hypothetical protein n=1 Tax=unclassified Pedobacter TaxID=2628915 RepID=UPI001E4330ED|nr:MULTISPECIES: hypothetical protein [unclassified Pedobacter]
MESHKENNAEKSNLPDNLVPKHHSNADSDKNKVKSEAGNLAKDFGKGDFGSEEARQDEEKGNKGEAGNMPNTVNEKSPE